MSDADTTYDAAHIEVLEGVEAVRKRPGMWVGSTGVRGLHHLVLDVVGRAVNEVMAGRAGRVDVVLTPDGGVRVADDGPGVPAEATADTDGPALEALLTSLHTGPEPGGRRAVVVSPTGSGGGLGIANALSSRLTAETWRDGTRWVQVYERGVPVTPPTAVGAAAGSGTTLAFRPDAEIFETVECSFAVLAERFRELAFLNRGLTMSLTDERSPAEPRSERFRFPGGVRDVVASLDAAAGAPVQPDVIGFEREVARMAGTVEVAFRWCDARDERIRSFANSRPTPEGGVHVVGFRDGVAAALTAYARQRRLMAAADPDLGADRIGEGLTAVVSVKLDRPEYLGATCGGLDGTAAMRAGVADAVREHLAGWLEGHPEQVTAVVGRLVGGPGPG